MPIFNESGALAGQLGQLRPANTTAVSIFSPRAKVLVKITAIIITNLDTNPHAYRLFHDDNGTTYNETTALAWDTTIIANDTMSLVVGIWMSDLNGNLAIRTDSANNINFTVYGEIWYGPRGLDN
tara:strand:+ start:120 stop:494 length:375 start_codon:yes stop_codon:yes gene_type:complete